MDEKSLTYKTFKNISYSFVGLIWGLIFSIFITPVVVLKLGVETYGVYILVATVNSVLGLFDLGIGYILVKYISEYTAAGEEQKLKNLMYSFNTILLVMSIFSLSVLSIVGWNATSFFPSQIISSQYYFVIFFLSGLISFVNGINSIFSVVPVALQRFDINTKMGMIYLAVSNLTMLLLVILGYSLRAIYLSQLFYAIIFFLISRYYAKMILPLSELKYAWHWQEVKKAYKFGFAVYMSNAANSALTYFDRLLISIFNGPAALAYYSLPGSIASKSPGVTSALSGVIFPMISSLSGMRDMEKIRNVYRRAFSLLTVVSFATTISIVLFANRMLLYWLNADFASKSTVILIILAFTYYILSLGATLNSFLLGLNKVKFLFHLSTFMAVINAGLLFLLLPKYGVVGAAWAYLISVLPVIYMFYYVEKKILQLDNRFFDYFKLYFKLAVVSVPFIIICKIGILPMVRSFTAIIILGPLSVLFFLLLYRVFGFFDREDIKSINHFFILIFYKSKNMVKQFLKIIISRENRAWLREKQCVLRWYLNGRKMPMPGSVKQNFILRHIRKARLGVFIETGTAGGNTVERVRKLFNKVISIEIFEPLALAAKERFRNFKHITIVQGDSGEVLPRVLSEIDEPAFFWLDGHYSGGATGKGSLDTPIIKELDAIFDHSIENHYVLIDDARCFDGTNDYPKIEDLKNYVDQKVDNMNFEVVNDIIIIKK